MSVSRISLNKKLLQVIVITTASALWLAGCGGGGSGSVSSAPIMINADSGTQQSLNGTWQSVSCGYMIATGFDATSEWTISGNSVTGVITVYTTNDGSCSGSVSATETRTATLVSDREITTLGWTDGAISVTAPINQAASNILQDPPVASGVIWDYIVNGVAYSDNELMYIDDSATSWCIYLGVDPAVYGGTGANGYAQYLIDNPSMCKI